MEIIQTSEEEIIAYQYDRLVRHIYTDGRPHDDFIDPPLRMGDVPEVEIEFLPSSETPVGLGETATTAVAPAIGNAIFAASGPRVRHLPIRPEAVRQALSRA